MDRMVAIKTSASTNPSFSLQELHTMAWYSSMMSRYSWLRKETKPLQYSHTRDAWEEKGDESSPQLSEMTDAVSVSHPSWIGDAFNCKARQISLQQCPKKNWSMPSFPKLPRLKKSFFTQWIWGSVKTLEPNPWRSVTIICPPEWHQEKWQSASAKDASGEMKPLLLVYFWKTPLTKSSKVACLAIGHFGSSMAHASRNCTGSWGKRWENSSAKNLA